LYPEEYQRGSNPLYKAITTDFAKTKLRMSKEFYLECKEVLRAGVVQDYWLAWLLHESKMSTRCERALQQRTLLSELSRGVADTAEWFRKARGF